MVKHPKPPARANLQGKSPLGPSTPVTKVPTHTPQPPVAPHTAQPVSPPAPSRHRDWHDYVTLFVAALALGVACVAAWFAKEQVAIAKDTEKRQLRAYVVALPTIKDFRPGMKPVFGVELSNGGQTPAYDFSAALNIKVDEFPQKAPLAGTGYKPGPVTPHGEGWGDFAYQSHKLDLSAMSTQVLTQSDFDGVMKGTAQRLYIWGRAEYADAFGERHYVNFCVSLDGESLRESRSHRCKDGNDAD